MKRKMLSRLMAASLAAIMTVGMAGCGNETGSSEPAPSNDVPESSNNNVTPDDGGNVDDGGEVADGGEELGQYTVINDPATGQPYDLGGVEIIIRDWWSPEEPEAPRNDYEEAQLDYREWAQETYNFTMKQVAISDWGSAPQDFVDYVSTGGDDNWYVFTLRDDVATTSAMATGLMYDLSTLDCLDFSEPKFTKNKLHQMYGKNGSIYCMYAGDSEPRTGIFFNKRLLTEAGINPEDIYDMQAAGTWTWDAWTDLMAQVQRDLDNDGVTDVWGFNVNNGVYTMNAIYSNGGELVGQDASGKYTYRLEDPETLEALEWAVSVFNDYQQVNPEDAQWDYYKTAFTSGECAFMVEDAYNITGMLVDMQDDWGFVMFPKGPRASDYTNCWSNNPACIPGCYDADKAWKIAFAWNLWTDDVPGYENYDGWKVGYLNAARDTRTVDETCAMMVEKGMITFHGVIPNMDTAAPFQWVIGKGTDVSSVVESVRESWKTYIDEANAM